MTAPAGTIRKVIGVLGESLRPLEDILADAGKAQSFLLELGLRAPVVPPSFLELREPVVQLGEALSSLEDLLEGTDEASPEALQNLEGLVRALAGVLTALKGLPSRLQNDFVAFPDLFDEIDPIELVDRLSSRLLCEYLKKNQPALFNFGVLFGVIENRVEGAGSTYGTAYVHQRIVWERIADWFKTPAEVVEGLYGWGTTDLEYGLLFERIRYPLLALGYRTLLKEPEYDADEEGEVDRLKDIKLHFPIYSETNEDASAAVYLVAGTLEPGTDESGVAFTIGTSGIASFELPLAPGITLELSGGFEAGGGIGLGVHPPLQLQALTGDDAGTHASGNFVARLILGRANDEPIHLLVQPGLFELSINGVALEFGLTASTESDTQLNIEAGLKEGLLKIGGKDADGFLNKILPPDGVQAPFEIGVGWRSEDGFYFTGSGGIGVDIPLHFEIGPLKIETLHAGLGFEASQVFWTSLGVTAGFELGPFVGSVQRIGVKALLSFPGEKSGNLGDANIGFEFVPPTGAGFSVDAGITGGGFLEFDSDNKRYTGILTLKCGEIGITAIGLITTKMPDGSKGFSMLVNIGVTFKPPIQLSMGFTLSGVGGIIGVNRTIMIDVLRAGVKKHTLDSILFPEPEWVIPNAAKVISDLRAVFPPADGRFVIGPMVKIGYGSPNIIIADIGVFIELPKPIRIVLLGQLSMLLPDPKKAIVRINLDIVGVLDMEKKELSFQASLYDSGILKFELYGDAAFFLGWGAQPEFAMSLGGFHPRFEPPPPPIVFADLKRLGLNLSSGSNFQLSCGVYQALTPNSLQFGARADLYATACGAEITGFLSFDTLIYFSPFSFEIDLGAGVAIRFKGIDLAEIRVALNLSGPTPWNARGTATIKILFFDLDVEFHITWGREDAARLDPIDPWPQLEQALLRAESWGSLLPVAANMVESLRKIEEEPVEVADGEEPKPAPVIVHPAGTLEIRQNIAPLNCTLKKFGNAPVCKHDRFRITSLTTSDGASLGVESLDEFFSRGQFEKLSNSQKLSVPSFEKMPGGVTTKASNRIVVQGQVRSEELCYESIVIKSDRTSTRPKTSADSKMAVSAWRNSRVLTAGNAYSRSALRNKGKSRFALKGGRLVKTAQEKYVIVDADTLQTVTIDQKTDMWSEKMTRTQAEQALAQHLTISSKEAQALIVISEYEAEEVA